MVDFVVFVLVKGMDYFWYVGWLVVCWLLVGVMVVYCVFGMFFFWFVKFVL